MLDNDTTCTHETTWQSHPPVPVQVQNGALLVTSMYCTNCGHVEYRSPPLSLQDEKDLQKRVNDFQKKQEILAPLDMKKGRV